MENEGEGSGRMETVGGDANETGSVTKKTWKNIDERYRWQPHPGLHG